ncbi:hypothetical protein [Orrella sp. 11846]|uniref:hypothetical protein n=1 Tax=Orrella sp. 11846 TaxID=3409913 RepID=UPI003B5979E9
MSKEKRFSERMLCTALLIGVAFGIVAGFTLGWLWQSRSGTLAGVRILDVLIAFGTVGSTATALWFGLSQTRKENKTRRIRKRIALQELQARILIAKNSAILLQGAYLAVRPGCPNESSSQLMDRIAGHLKTITELFDKDFLEGFSEALEDQAAQLITQLSSIRLLKIEFGIFSFHVRNDKEKAINLALKNRQQVGQFLGMLNDLEKHIQ